MVELSGLPEGWRAVRWGKPNAGDWIFVGDLRHQVMCPDEWVEHLIIAKVEEEQGVRPFKDAGEFLDACDGHFWLVNIDTGASEFVAYVDDNGIETLRGATSYSNLYECYEFPDGRACGHED
jgi:hypothetical protein